MGVPLTVSGRAPGCGLDPLRIHGTELPANLLLAAKCVFVVIAIQGLVVSLPEPFLPLVPGLRPSRPAWIAVGMRVVALAAGVALLLNRKVRIASLALGLVVLFALLGARGWYRNGRFFVAAVLILIGLWRAPWGTRLIHVQLVLVYAGSALNKVFEPDWWTGRYFEHWMRDIIGNPIYVELADLLPPLVLSTAMGWLTIGVEAALAIGFAVPPLHVPTVVVAVAFHAASVIAAGTTFGVFVGVLAVSFLVFFEWPEPGRHVMRYDPGRPGHRGLRWVAHRLDRERQVRWVTNPAGSRLTLEERGAQRDGVAAVIGWAARLPATWLSIAALFGGTILLRDVVAWGHPLSGW